MLGLPFGVSISKLTPSHTLTPRSMFFAALRPSRRRLRLLDDNYRRGGTFHPVSSLSADNFLQPCAREDARRNLAAVLYILRSPSHRAVDIRTVCRSFEICANLESRACPFRRSVRVARSENRSAPPQVAPPEDCGPFARAIAAPERLGYPVRDRTSKPVCRWAYRSVCRSACIAGKAPATCT